MAVTSLKVTSVKSRVSAEEWQTRVDLAGAYRLAVVYGMTDMIANHISAAVPGEPGHFLINPYGLLYQEITASSLVKIDLAGNIIAKSEDLDYGINRAGFVIHSAIHQARPDAFCVMHTHTRAGMAVSALKCGLLPITQTATRFAQMAYHDFEGIVLDDSEQESIVRDLGDFDAMILRNHGLLTVGSSIQEAFNTMYRLELSCKTQVDAMSCNTELNIPSPDAVERAYGQWKPSATRRRFGLMEWGALMRELDRIDPGFRE